MVGEGWLIIDFFATDCEPCKKELPELEAFLEANQGEGLTVLVFATDKEGVPLVKPFFDENPTSATVLIDRYGVAAGRYGVESIPTVFVIDPEGSISVKGVGYSEEVIAHIRENLGR